MRHVSLVISCDRMDWNCEIPSMKIGIVILKDDPQIGGGLTFVQEILDAFSRHLSTSPHTFHLVGGEPAKPAHLAHIPLPWITLRWVNIQTLRENGVTYDFDSYPEIAEENFDLLYYLHPWSCPIKDIPYIHTVWDLQHRRQPFFPEVTLGGEFDRREEMYRRSLQRATYIIAANNVGREEIVAFYQVAPERVRAIHHPTPAFALEAAAHPDEEEVFGRLGIKGDYLLYPAQMWPHKNHVLLLLMLNDLRARYGYELQLVFTGSNRGNQEFLKRRARELAVEDQVIFAGFVTQAELVPIYQRAVAMVFPSLFGPENFPPLEAFALGCPVIAGRVPGAEDQMGDAAILVDPTKPELWSDAVQRLRQDLKLRRSLVSKGKERALRFTSDDFIKEVFSLIDEFATYRRTWPSSDDA